MKIESANPLLCDYETGTCELPGSATIKEATIAIGKKQKAVQVNYFTDPICSACWGIEPQLRKLKLEYDAYFNIEYYMGGLLPSWNGFNSGGIAKPSDVAKHWDEAGRHYQMPIDGDIWLEDPLSSSYPPSVAFIAAKMQDGIKAEKFLRRIKEMIFIEKKNITKWEHLHQAAVGTGLDTTKFKQDFEGGANKLFRADLDFSRVLGVRGFPTLFFENDAGKQQVLNGVKPYEHFEQAILQVHPGAKKATPDIEDIFSYYPTLTTKEFSVITNRTMEASQVFLQELADNNTVARISGKNSAIWKTKK
jgi:putative protein-disulfide isomerase